jgi:hypothetical protein
MAANAGRTMKVMYGVVCLLFFAGVLGTAGYVLYQDGDKTLKEWKGWASQSSRTASKNGPFAGSRGIFIPLKPGMLGTDYQANAVKQFQKVQDAINSSGGANRFPAVSPSPINPIPGVNTFSAGGSIPGSGATLPRPTRP